MKNLTIGTRIWTLLAASWLLAAGSTGFLYMHLRSMIGSYEQLIGHNVHDQDTARQVRSPSAPRFRRGKTSCCAARIRTRCTGIPGNSMRLTAR